MFDFNACYHTEFVSDFANKINLIAEYFGIKNVNLEILDEEAYLYIQDQLVKEVDVDVKNIEEFLKKDITCIVTNNEEYEDPQEPDLMLWSAFVEDTKITTSNNDFLIYHCYALDLLFILCKDDVSMLLPKEARLTREEFDHRMNSKPAYRHNRYKHVIDLLDGEDVEDFFDD